MIILNYSKRIALKVLKAFFMIILITFVFLKPITVYAENEEEATNNTSDYTIEQRFSKDYYLTGLMTSTKEFFNVEDWEISDAEFNMFFATTQLAKENLSDLTISVNSKRFYSERISATDGEKRELSVKIPSEYIKEGSNLITIETYIRTSDEYPCVDDVVTANWINIFKESVVKIDYSNNNDASNISDFYESFVSIHALNNELSSIIINPSYDEDELQAALKVMTGASSQATKFYDNIDFAAKLKESEWSDYKFVIYVAKTDHLPQQLASQLSDNIENLEVGQGFIQFIGGDINYLVITAKDADGLNKVANMMMNRLLIDQSREKSIVLDTDMKVNTREIINDQVVNFASDGQYIKGAFRQTADFYVDNPSNRMIAAGSEISIDMKYSENLDFNRSLVTLYIDDVPIGSRKLIKNKVGKDNFTVQIPSYLNVAGPFKLTVAYDLEIQDLWCTLRQPDTPWAYVTNESYMNMKYTDIPYYLFEYYPSPFINEGMYNNVVIVVPNDNKEIQIKALAKIINLMGRSVNSNRGDFEVYRASEIDEKTIKDKNIILFGTIKDNRIIREVNEHLFFKFDDKGTRILSNSKMNLGSISQKNLGTVQLLNSPYSNLKLGMLVVSGVQQEGVMNASELIGSADGLWKIYGDGCVVDSKDVYPFRFKKDNAQSRTVSDRLKDRTDVTGFIVITVLLVMLIVVIVILMTRKYGWKGKHSNEKK